MKGRGIEIITRLRNMSHPIAWRHMSGVLGTNDRAGEAWAIAGGARLLGSHVLYTKQLGRSGSSRACVFALA